MRESLDAGTDRNAPGIGQKRWPRQRIGRGTETIDRQTDSIGAATIGRNRLNVLSIGTQNVTHLDLYRKKINMEEIFDG